MRVAWRIVLRSINGLSCIAVFFFSFLLILFVCLLICLFRGVWRTAWWEKQTTDFFVRLFRLLLTDIGDFCFYNFCCYENKNQLIVSCCCCLINKFRTVCLRSIVTCISFSFCVRGGRKKLTTIVKCCCGNSRVSRGFPRRYAVHTQTHIGAHTPNTHCRFAWWSNSTEK